MECERGPLDEDDRLLPELNEDLELDEYELDDREELLDGRDELDREELEELEE